MLDENIEKLAQEKGFTIAKNKTGFAVNRNGRQVRFCFNEAALLEFLEGNEADTVISSEEAQPVREKIIERTVTEIREVVVTDINMPFTSMVGFMVKWVIASIPALIILMFLATIAFAFLGVFFI